MKKSIILILVLTACTIAYSFLQNAQGKLLNTKNRFTISKEKVLDKMAAQIATDRNFLTWRTSLKTERQEYQKIFAAIGITSSSKLSIEQKKKLELAFKESKVIARGNSLLKKLPGLKSLEKGDLKVVLVKAFQLSTFRRDTWEQCDSACYANYARYRDEADLAWGGDAMSAEETYQNCLIYCGPQNGPCLNQCWYDRLDALNDLYWHYEPIWRYWNDQYILCQGYCY